MGCSRSHRRWNRRQFLTHNLRLGSGLGALAAGVGFHGCGSAGDPVHRPHIVLITLDTTRADHLGCYGYPLPTSPRIDWLARESHVYRRMIAPATWTLPSHACIFTGKFTTSHGAQYDPSGQLRLTQGLARSDPSWSELRVRTIDPDEPTLAGLLGQHGYQTAGIVAGPWLKRIFGLARGFDHFDDNEIRTLNGRLAEEVTDCALNWLYGASEGPKMLFANYFDPHTPLQPPPQFANRFLRQLPRGERPERAKRHRKIALYDAEINYMDFHVGRLLDGLKQRNMYANSWIIITSDHGELLGEHGQTGHGDIPLQGVIHIPCIIKPPGPRPAGPTRDRWLQLTDLMPMILSQLKIDIPTNIQGHVPPNIQHPIITESRVLPKFKGNGNWLSLIQGNMKFIWNSHGHHLLFDVASDPRENNNLLEANRMQAKSMEKMMVDYLAGLPLPDSASSLETVDDETVESLRALGYVD